MRKIQPAIVLVKTLQSSVSATEWNEALLNEAAHLILAGEGVISPPVLRRTGLDSYTVVEGHFEYYAAVRAREIDPYKGETINAYIIESDDDEQLFRDQISLFRHSGREIQPAATSSSSDHLEVMRSLNGISKQQGILEGLIARLKAEITEVKNQSSLLTKKIDEIGINPQVTLVDHQFNELLKVRTEVKVSSKSALPTQEFLDAIQQLPSQQFLEAVNTLPIPEELERRLKDAGANMNIIKNLISERQKSSFQPFSELGEMLTPRIKHLTETQMLKILQNWS